MSTDIRWMTADILIKVTGVLIAGIFFAAITRKCAAATRHLVWLLTIGATLALPVLCALLPAWRVLPVAQRQPIAPQTPSADLQYQRHQGGNAVELPAPASAQDTSAMPTPANTPAASPAIAPDAIAIGASLPVSRYTWLFWYPLIWLAGTMVLLGRLVVSSFALSRIASQSTTVIRPEILEQYTSLCRNLGIRREVLLRMSDTRAMPMTWGIIWPVVLLPASANQWPAKQVRLALLHELAHVARCDAFAQLAGQFACAVYWFHPLVWIAAGGLRREQELAADDRVLAIDARGPDYAAFLVDLARNVSRRFSGDRFAIAMARPSHMECRVRAVLDCSRRKNALSFFTATIAVVASIGIVAPVAALRGQTKPAVEKTASPKPNDAGVHYAGHVLSPDGNPVAGAEVLLQDYGSGADAIVAETRSAGDGSFTLSAPPPVDKEVQPFMQVWHPGFAASSIRPQSDKPCEIHLSAVSIARVVFLAPDGTPVPNLRVRPLSFLNHSLQSVILSSDRSARLSKTTDAQGACAFDFLPTASRVNVAAEDERFARLSMNDVINTGGSQGTPPVTIHLRRAGVISGKVTYGKDGAPAVGIHLIAVARVGPNEGIGGRDAIVTNERGEYRMSRVGEGTYVISLLTHRGQDIGWTASFVPGVRVDSGATVTDQNLVLIKGSVVRGRVYESDTNHPVVDGTVDSLDLTTQRFAGWQKTDAEGRYAVRVPPGRFAIRFNSLPPEGYSNDDPNGRESGLHEITAVDGVDQTLDIPLRPKAGIPVTGRVVDADGKPAPGAIVRAFETGGQQVRGGTFATADSEGRFHFRALPAISSLSVDAGNAGTLTPIPVRVRAANDKGDFNLKVERGAGAASVRVHPGDDDVVIKLAKNVRTSVDGIIVDSTGKPVSNAALSLTEMPTGIGYGFSIGGAAAVTDAAGHFTLPNLRAGLQYSTTITADGFVKREQFHIEFTPGEEHHDLGRIFLDAVPVK